MHMPERPIIAVALSVAVHVVLVGSAALVPVRPAGAFAHLGQAEDGAHLGDAVTELGESGLSGNTVEVDRVVEGELGGGSRQAPSQPASSDAAPAQRDSTAQDADGPPAPQTKEPTTPKARQARRERRRRAKPGQAKRRAPRPDPRAGGQAETGDGGEGNTPGVGVRHGTGEAKPSEPRVAGSITHAIPMAFSANPLWHDLELGVVAEAAATIMVKDGKVTGVSYPGKDTPALIRQIVDGALIMIRARKVSLTLSEDATGEERLLVTVTISKRELTADEKAVAADKPVLQMSDVPPTADAPGNGNFTFASGRHVEVKIALSR